MDYIHNILTIVAIAFPSTALAQSSLCQGPTQKGGFTQLNQPTDFAIINDRAYILNNAGNELLTIDLSTAPDYTLINTLTFNDTGFLEITAAGDALYLTNNSPRITTIDRTNPDAPQHAGNTFANTSIDIPLIHNGYMYAGPSQIYSLADPLNPQLIGTMQDIGTLAYADDTIAYTTTMAAVDLSNPLLPARISEPVILTGNDFTTVDVDHASNTAYLSNQEGIYVLDITDPLAPDISDEIYYRPKIHKLNTARANALIILGDYNLELYDTSSISQSLLIEESLEIEPMGESLTHALAIDADTLYAAFEHSFIAYTLDQAPHAASVRIPTPANGISLSENIAMITSDAGRIDIFNLDAPAQVSPAGSLVIPHDAISSAIMDQTAYVAASDGGTWILDISNPADPRPVATLDTGNKTRDVRIVDDLLFVLDRLSGLYIYRLTDPFNPEPVSHTQTLTRVEHMAIDMDQGIISIAGGTTTTQIYDISDISNPTLLTTIEPLTRVDGGIMTTTIDGDLLYTAEFYDGFRIWDITDPTSPRLIRHVENEADRPEGLDQSFNSIAHQISITEQQLIVANGDEGVVFYDNTDPQNPIVSDHIPTRPNSTSSASARRMVIRDGYAYTSLNQGGFRVYNILSCAPCPADLNNDGMVDFHDVSRFLGSFAEQFPEADLNHDGEWDFFDVTLFIVAYNNGCP